MEGVVFTNYRANFHFIFVNPFTTKKMCGIMEVVGFSKQNHFYYTAKKEKKKAFKEINYEQYFRAN